MKTIYPSIFNTAEVRKEIDRSHDRYVLIPADKAGNIIAFVCKTHYINCIFKKLGFSSTYGNFTNTHSCSLSKQEISLKSPIIKVNLIYLNCTGFQRFSKVLTNRDIQQVPVNETHSKSESKVTCTRFNN